MDSIDSVEKEALFFIKKHKKEIIERFASRINFPSVQNPESYFMAGSPGAGKTEFSRVFINDLMNTDHSKRIVRIDLDEIRDLIPESKKMDCNLFTKAASKGVEILFDYAHHNSQNMLLDGTFSKYEISLKNIKRSLDKNRKIVILYLYQDPLVAWRFTKIREKLEKRFISKQLFIQSFLAAKQNVNKIKSVFASKITLNLIIKDLENDIAKYHINIDNVDSYLKCEYGSELLSQKLI